jgi:hypothetical protein
MRLSKYEKAKKVMPPHFTTGHVVEGFPAASWHATFSAGSGATGNFERVTVVGMHATHPAVVQSLSAAQSVPQQSFGAVGV